MTENFGILGIHQYQVPCIIGVYPEEREREQMLMMDAKIKVDLSRCLISGQFQDTIDYVLIAQICMELAQQRQYVLLETLASDILDACLQRCRALWAWVRIQKPSAIPSAAYAFVELERHRKGMN